MAAQGREVLRGRLLYRPRKGSWKKRLVVAHCGTQGGSQAQIYLFEDYEKCGKQGPKPKKFIELSGAKIDTSPYSSPNGSHNNSPYNSSPSPKSGSLGTSPGSNSLTSDGGVQHFFQIVTSSEVHEFRTQSENERIQWVKLLGLLVLFPRSLIPEEPKQNPIKESLRYRLDQKNYGDADSVWTVYILPEEVGSRCHVIGMNVLALRSGASRRTVGRLDIINPADPANPIVSWDRDKMRRTGKTGNLVFIEIGRRCEGGPGLVWMYAGFDEAQALRETLHNFLFQGDGKAVPIQTRSTTAIYDIPTPRPSYDSSCPSGYQKRGSYPAGYQYYQVPPNGRLADPDSGNPASPLGHSPLSGPPVRLDKHPSFRKQRSLPCDISRRRSPHSGSVETPPGHSVDSLIDEDTLFDETALSISRSMSPQEQQDGDRSSFADTESGYVAGHMDMGPDVFSPETGAPQRSNSEPPLFMNRMTIPSRHHSTGTCSPASRKGEYERMVHPHAAMYEEKGYIYMRPGDLKLQQAKLQTQAQTVEHSSAIPVVPQQGEEAEQQAFDDSPSSMSSQRYQNYDYLPTIQEVQPSEKPEVQPSKKPEVQPSKKPEAQPSKKPEAQPSKKPEAQPIEKPDDKERLIYENHPLPAEVKNAPEVVYQPTYENVITAREERRGSQRREQYENVTRTGEQISSSSPPSGKRASLRRKSDKEDVVINGNGLRINGQEIRSPSPPKNGLQFPYTAIQHSRIPDDHTNPTVKEVQYSSVDFHSTDGVQSLHRERVHQKALAKVQN